MTFYKKLCVSLLKKHGKSSILFVGDIGKNLEKIATEQLHESDQFSKVVEISTSNKLPLPSNNSDDVIYASLVVFVIDVRNKESLSSAKESLKYVPVDFFMGRILFLGLNLTNEHQWCIEPEEIMILANKHDFCPVLWMELSTTANRSSTYLQILRKLELAESNISNLSPLTADIPIRS